MNGLLLANHRKPRLSVEKLGRLWAALFYCHAEIRWLSFCMEHEIIYHRLDADNAHLLLCADIFDHKTDPKQLNNFVAHPGHELVFAMAAGRPVGMASGVIMLHPDKHPMLFISEVGVNEDMRQRGIGARLSNMLMKIGRAQGCKGIWLATEIDNVEARALYDKLDGRETKDIVVYDWDGAMDD